MDAYAGRVMEAEYTANSAIQEREFDSPSPWCWAARKPRTLSPSSSRSTTPSTGSVSAASSANSSCAPTVTTSATTSTAPTFRPPVGRPSGDDRTRSLRVRRPSPPRERPRLRGRRGRTRRETVEEIEKATSYLDVGGETTGEYVDLVGDSEAVFVKGALGVFEDERFADGTVDVLSAIAETDCFSVVGGGDTARSIEMYDLDEDDFSHVSVAGGAYVRALTGEGWSASTSSSRPTERGCYRRPIFR